MPQLIIIGLIIFGFSKCSDSSFELKDKYDSGYGDGYAVGYNSTCNIRTTLIDGDWSSESYTRGYNDGKYDGSVDCNVDRKNGRIK